jgi:hypothetical protein
VMEEGDVLVGIGKHENFEMLEHETKG